MRKREWIIFIVFLLSFLGIMMVLSASYVKSLEKFGDGFFYFKKQVGFVAVGFVLLTITSLFKPRFYYRFSYILLLIVTVLLILVFVPGIGVKINGAYRWIKVGGFTLQPSEYAKIVLVVSFARIFSDEGRALKKFVIPLVLYLIIGGLILVEPDFGTAGFLFAVTITACFVGGVPLKYIFSASLIVVSICGLFLMNNKVIGERKERIVALINPDEYANSKGYQILQSLYAIGAGGITGVGAGEGKSKLHYLPEPFTDYIFSVLGEELGFLGTCFLLCLFTALFILGVRISISANEPFIALSTFLITFVLCFQAAIHIGVALALLPPKGITLPFVSYGGNSIFSSFIAIGIILSMAGRNER